MTGPGRRFTTFIRAMELIESWLLSALGVKIRYDKKYLFRVDMVK